MSVTFKGVWPGLNANWLWSNASIDDNVPVRELMCHVQWLIMYHGHIHVFWPDQKLYLMNVSIANCCLWQQQLSREQEARNYVWSMHAAGEA